jgi:hypothetical protein
MFDLFVTSRIELLYIYVTILLSFSYQLLLSKIEVVLLKFVLEPILFIVLTSDEKKLVSSVKIVTKPK